MKRRLRRLLALVCALALALSLSGPVSAAGDIYFTVLNDSVVSLSDSTMPTWSGGVLYVHYSAFDGSNTARIGFDISFSYNRSSGMATLFNTRQFLTFNMNNNTSYNALTGEYLNGRAILRNGQVFVPVALVCSFFGLSYSVISIDEGYIVRIKDNSVVLSDPDFVEAATLSISRELRSYNQANQSTATPGVRPPTGGSGETETNDLPIEEEPDTADSIPVYLAFRCDDDQGLSDILDILDERNRAAVFFFPAEELERQDDLLYRILGSGHSVGLLAEGSSLAATRQLLEEGGQVLERVGYTRTTLALVPERQRSALEAEGWVCWDETASAIPEAGTGASSHANAVIRAIPSRSQRAYITLDAGSESARVLPTLLTRLEARSYAVSVPLETRL